MGSEKSTQALPTGRWVAIWLLNPLTPEGYVVGRVVDVLKHGVSLETAPGQIGSQPTTLWVPWENVGGAIIGLENQSFDQVLEAAREFARTGNRPAAPMLPGQMTGQPGETRR